MGVERAAYIVEKKDGAFEVRQFASQIVAEITVDGTMEEAGNKAFRPLFNYISGANRTQGKIAMTAPVSQQRDGEKIAMTAPVTEIQNAGEWVVRFTMPSAYSMDTLPEPNDPKVQLRLLPPARYAVLQFSGLARKDDVADKTAELEKLVASHQLRPIGPASLSQYNPPWTLWFMRRNEVMIPVAP